LDGADESVHIIADTKSNRLLINGSEKIQRVASKVLKQIDLPPSLENSTAKESTVKSYPCPKTKLNSVVEKLRERYSDMNGVRIAGYSAGERLLILAPPEIHNEIRGMFAADSGGTTKTSSDVSSRPARDTSRDLSKSRQNSSPVRPERRQQR